MRTATIAATSPRQSGRQQSRGWLARAAVLGLVLGMLNAAPAFASSVSSAVFTGGTGSALVGGTLYARQGTALTLTVDTSSDTKCVEVAGTALNITSTSLTGKTRWTFATVAGAGEGAQAATAAASPNVNAQGKCTGPSSSMQAAFALDNTGPIVTAGLSPAANAAGWNKANVTAAWSATDAGSGVASGPAPETASVSANTSGDLKTATATDRVGNTSSGSATVKLDKTNPVVSGSRAPAANAAGWNNSNVTVSFGCTDALSGIKTCTGSGSVLVSAEGANQSVSGTAVDNADNSGTGSVDGISIDKTAPALSGLPTSTANAAGWYNGNVSVAWSAADGLSGLAGPVPSNSTIMGEGSGLHASKVVSDLAGNTIAADSSPVDIDRTAPTTGISGASKGWSNGTVTVTLSPSDNLSGVATTRYSIDGGSTVSGTTLQLSSEGDHSISFFSTDKAGNTEAAQTARVKIDKTAPTIGHSFTPLGYLDGAWTNQNVTVTFDCADSGSGVASCTPPAIHSAEGAAQQVTGTATDNAGNTATDTAVLSIDRSAPSLAAASDRAANGAGWYNDSVTVNFTASDAFSGITNAPSAQVLGEGANQSAAGTATDAAGNSTSASVTGINIDTTAPVLSTAYPHGWNTTDVAVTWTCTDALSGVATGPTNDTVSGEGANLSSSATCTDTAGNTASVTVFGIQIDRASPTTTATVPAPPASGWYADAVDVTLTGLDALSGIATTSYTVDGGATQEYTGPFAFALRGTHVLSFWSTDVAGNAEDSIVNSLTLEIDGNAPTTTVINPISPASGWFVTSGIPVAFDASDAESGIAGTYYTIDGGDTLLYGEPFTEKLSLGLHTIAYWSVDLAGNVEDTRTTEVWVDTVRPSISGLASPEANGYGWNNTAVDVAFSCSDANSGIDSLVDCGPGVILGVEGADQVATGTTADVAGNVNSATVENISIDLTDPSLSGAATTPANGAGWYQDDVTVAWTAADALSGIAVADTPDDSTITGEGDQLSAEATVSDRAGNTAAATVTGIKLDRTAPVVTGAPTAAPNAAGWYRSQVVVDFACTDALSGVASCPISRVIAGNGANQGVTSAPATDLAGNDSVGTTVHGINVDGAAPSTSADNRCTAVNDYCTRATADVVLSADDQDGLSGVAELHYTLDNGTEQVVTGSTTTVSVPLNGSGAASVSFWAVDHAGNVETAQAVALKWDNIAPTLSHLVSPAPNATGWNRDDVTVTFTATDDDLGSGMADVTAPQNVSTETLGLPVNGSATDIAGNVGTDSVTVKLDKTAPTISGAIVSGTIGSNGWYLGPVTVHFSCADALSGLATCPDDVTLTDNGANTASGTARDIAGNPATATVTGISIDQELPSTSALLEGPLSDNWYTGTVTLTLSGHDLTSGVAVTTYSVDGAETQSYSEPISISSQGAHSIEYWSTDVAGNVETSTSVGFTIDSIAPVTTLTDPVSPASGWFQSSDIPLTVAATDAESGVEGTYFTIDGGAPQIYLEALTTQLPTGSHEIGYWSEDFAGNLEATRTTVVKVDTVLPTIAGTASPTANSFGWNNSNVDVTFACTDTNSGIAGCGPDTTVGNEGAGQSVRGDAIDVAGNTGFATVENIRVDKTAPSLSGAATTDSNGAGWYRGDVTVAWTGTDGLSGIDAADKPANSVIDGEGSDLGASATVSDRAGNGAGASVTGIRIDRTTPTLSGAPTTNPNTFGWYRSQVLVDFSCFDALSGVAHCPSSLIFANDGANQSVTSTTAGDLAGHESAAAVVSGINVDGTAPSSTANNVCTLVNGFCTGSTATVTVSGVDQVGLSGVRELHYSIDGGAEQVEMGSTKTLSVPLDGSGVGTVRYWAVDYAGNTEAANAVSLKWDNIAPTVTHGVSPAANANDWNNSDLTVTFTARDDDSGSGIARVTDPVNVSVETAGRLVAGSATDTAGNVGTDSVTVKLDKTAPSISAAIASGVVGSNGWYLGPVKVRFSCADALSGIATCTDDVTLTANGANTANGATADRAGNSAATVLSGIKIDMEAPSITSVNVAGGFYTLGAVPAVTCSASDSFSGLLGTCAVTVTGGTPNGVGTFRYTATAIDSAGNTSVSRGSYKVVYRFDGFLQPINDTAHQVGVATSVFKGGSTVPVKFQLKTASGTVVLSSSAPKWLTPDQGSAMSLPVDESLYTAAADSGSSYRGDGGQYIYNWKTGTGGHYYRIGVLLDDGQAYFVDIGLR